MLLITFLSLLVPIDAQCGTSWCSPSASQLVSTSYYPAYIQSLPLTAKYQSHYPLLPYSSQNSPQFQYSLANTNTTPFLKKETALESYDNFEKELEKLKPGADVASEDKEYLRKETKTLNLTSTSPTTYVRDNPSFVSVPYPPRPLPYRPAPYIPLITACQQYLNEQALHYYPGHSPVPQSAYATPPAVNNQKQSSAVIPPPINDCCGKCGVPCNLRHRKNIIALASKIFESQFVPRRATEEEDEPKDPKCNSEKLKDLMSGYITRTVSLSKRLIQKHAEIELGGLYSVFCSAGDFSYVVRSETFCQLEKNGIFCYAFKHF